MLTEFLFILYFFDAGQNLCLEFAKLGCFVVGWDISESGLQETKRKMKEIGLAEKWHSYACDISDRHRVYETADKVNNAHVQGITKLGHLNRLPVIKSFLGCFLTYNWSSILFRNSVFLYLKNVKF